MAEKKKVVLAGCGGISNSWIHPALNREDLEFVGFVDLNHEAAERRAREHSLDVVTGTDLRAVIAETGAEIVFDCTIPAAHAQVVITAMENGCDVLGEKPMADTLENARRMVAAAQQTGRTYAVIQNRRYLPQIRAVREFIASGALGKITTVQSDFFIGAHFGGFRAAMQHVLLLDMAIHTFDAARYLSGCNATAVYAQDWNPAGSWYTHGAAAMAFFEMSDGVRYLYHGSWCSEGRNTSWESSWRIIGTNGSLTWDGRDSILAEQVAPAETLIWTPAPIDVPIPAMPEERQRHSGLIGDFLASLDGGACPPTICTDNIKSLAMVHAAIESSESGQRVPIDL